MVSRKKLNLVVSVLIGLVIFGIFLYVLGVDAIVLIVSNISFPYLGIYLGITTLTFFANSWRLQIIMKAHKKKVPFKDLFRQNMAGYAVSYVTPSVRLGGEPLKVYMMKKENKVDYKTGSSGVIVDKFVELAGTVAFGAVGMIILLNLPEVPLYFKGILAFLIVGAFYVLAIFYYRTVKGKGSFSVLFNFFRLHKIARFKNFVRVLKDVERKLDRFFRGHKKEFFLSFFAYGVYGVLAVLEMKFLLLSFGVSLSVGLLIVVLTVLGLINFIPVPASLGFLEAGQSGLFYFLKGEGSIGFALSLMLRIRNLLFTALGFGLISHFSGRQVERVLEGKKIKKK
jgi:uncharacterized protein (TIRG00374 family)